MLRQAIVTDVLFNEVTPRHYRIQSHSSGSAHENVRNMYKMHYITQFQAPKGNLEVLYMHF